MRIEGTPDPPKPSGNLRGLEKFARPPEEVRETAEDVGEVAVESDVTVKPSEALRGLDKFPSSSTGETETKLIPEGYDMPPEVVEKTKIYKDEVDYEPYEDPEGLITPGLVLISPRDPEHRRLIVNTVRSKSRGKEMTVVHIEGGTVLHKYPMEDIRQKIAEGSLVLPMPSSSSTE